LSAVLSVKNLTKNFGALRAVDDISFTVEKGSVFSFIGPNGAGKSTTINIILGLLSPDGGRIDFADGFNVQNVGVVFQNNIGDDLLTVKENLLTFGAQYFRTKTELFARYDELRDFLSLNEVENKKFKILSGGQKRKIEIARALLHRPRVLFLDEPTTGLDPKTRKEIWDIIQKLKNESDLTVFLTTHYMEETAGSDMVAVIQNGKIAATGTPQKLKAKYSFDRLFITPNDAAKLKKSLMLNKLKFSQAADTFVITADSDKHAIEIIEKLKDNILYFEFKKGTMDDVFLNIVGEVGE
jgi:multidrug/hemolysin transport system ATP-binding protein